MSTDPNQPSRPSAPPPREPEGDVPQAAPPTVKAPAVKAQGQEPPTQAVPAWQSPPPPPPPPPAPRRPGRQEPPTLLDQAPPAARTDRAPQRPVAGQPQPQPRRPQPQQPPQQRQQPPQQWQQPRPWTEPQPWVEPQDNPARQPQRPGQQAQPPGSQPPRLRRRQRKRRVRRSVMALFTVIVLLILLVIGDRVALAVTENQFASQLQSNGLPVKPSVGIEGFPFLPQLLGKDFHTVDISASNVPAGPVSITSISAKIQGLRFSSLSSNARVSADRVDATVFVSFGALTAAGGIPGGSQLTVTPAGPNTVKISADLGGILSDSEEAQITATGPQTISVKVLPGGGPLGSLLGSFGSFSFTLPQGVPPSLKITNLDLNSQGLTISASATNAVFPQK